MSRPVPLAEMQEKSLWRGMNKKQLQHTIKETSAGLDQLYDRSWQRITQSREWERRRIYVLLRWAAFALRPLTVCEVTEAVLVDESEDLPIEDLPDAVDDDYIDNEIVDLCGPLLEVRSQRAPRRPQSQSPNRILRWDQRSPDPSHPAVSARPPDSDDVLQLGQPNADHPWPSRGRGFMKRERGVMRDPLYA
ncbi:hypothetical protein B0T10DRAFT_585400 [Thelonectria olida]|uniref:Uncharacterized protein n=1 Tax=Thelonectria olida TaxID=1576542 RepID=A0A9P8VW90_9HYPO|nr:hypothetical protein B0T10DRAFT_585400 [Thelonectria olida]